MQRKIVGFSEAGFPIYDDELIREYTEFIKAIIDQARKDYIRVYEELITAKTERRIRELEAEKDDIESFFFSDWFEHLIGVACPPSYVRNLQQKALERLKEKHRKRAERNV